MPIRLVDKAALKIAQRFSAGRTKAERSKSRKGRQNRFFRPCGTLVSYYLAQITGQTREAARKAGEVFQPRAGERSEVEGGLAREVRLVLRAIPPPVPILPREIENLAYFAAPRRQRHCPVNSER